MQDENLLADVSGSLFRDLDDEADFGLSTSDINRLKTVSKTLVDNSELELAELIDGAIAENSGSDSKVASQLNGVPEEGVGDQKDDKKDDKKDEISINGDTLEGTDNDDLMFATTADKSLYGKKGEDTIKGSLGKDTIYAGKGNDDCEGGDGDDQIKGDQDKDKIKGDGGNDKLEGGKNEDTLFGGTGNDTCKGDDGDDWAQGNEGKDDVGGDKGNDTLYGGKGDDTCKGGEDKDIVKGDQGNDNCSGDDGDDSVYGGKGDDTAIGGSGKDTCSGDEGDDSVSGGAGDDSLIGGAGNDTCSGDEGDDGVSGGAGDDSLIGGAGNDTCSGDDGDDSVVGGAGDDSVVGGGGQDTVVAGDGTDVVDGGDGDDSVVGGGSGDDTLMGSGGNDTIVGGTGNHTCTGGLGDDVFVITDRTSGASSFITDFTENDKFLLSVGLSFSSLTIVQVGANTEIRNSSSFVLAVLLNVNASILKASNFLQADGTPSNDNVPPKNNPVPIPPFNNPPKVEANKDVLLGSGKTQTITPNDLKFGDAEQSASQIVFTLTELPPATTGQLLLKGVVVAQVGVTFTQADINAGVLTFQAAVGFVGAATFGFTVTDGKTTVSGQSFSLNVVQTVFNFAGNTAPQVIVGSVLDDDIQGGDGDDDIKGGEGPDKIQEGPGNGKIAGDAGNDDIDAGDGDDDVEGGSGDDKIITGKDKDKAKGGDGNDDIDTGDGDDDVEGGSGDDKIITGKDKDKAKGGDGNDDIDTGDDDDEIEGGLGNDKGIGGPGNDKLTGDEGDDTLEGGEGTNTLKGGVGNDTFVYNISRENIETVAEADLIEDFSVDNDVLQFSNAAFGLSVTSLTRVEITATSTVGSIGSANLLDFSADITVTSIATLQARFLSLGGNTAQPTFCQFTDAETGRNVLVYAVDLRFDLVASFSAKFSLQIKNFVFTGPPLAVPVGTPGPDNLDCTTSPAGIKLEGLAGDDNLIGSKFNDTINGGDGNDTITGGLGLDVLSGGTGADIFVYRTTKEGGDKISDFKSGTDKFQFVSSEFGNLTTTNFDAVSGSAPDITGKELVIFTGGTFVSLEAAQAQALGSSTSPGFFVYNNAANETVLAFDSNGTIAGGFTKVANLGTAAGTLAAADFVFTGSLGSAPAGTSTSSGSIVDLTAPGNTYPIGSNNFGSGAGGYNFTTPVLFTGDATANSVTGTEFADILTGGSGADIVTGGAGADIFAFKAPGEGGDTITDFTAGSDKFQFVSSAFGNLTTTNFDGVSGSTPDITGKELVIFTGGNYTSVEAAQATAVGNSTSAGFFAFSNAANETVLYFDSNGTTAGGSTLVANLGSSASGLGTADFVFTGASATTPAGTSTNSGSIVDLTAPGNTYPIGSNNFGSGAGGYNFTTPVLFTGDATANSVTGTEFADILTGGSGADIVTGGAGADIFAFKAPGEGGDTITDFTAGSDKFQFVSSAFGNLTTTNFDGVSGSTPDITGKELVIFTGGNYTSVEAAQATAVGNSTSAGFFAFSNAANETVLYFDSNGTTAGGSTLVANLGSSASGLGTADFVFTGTISSAPVGSTTTSGSTVNLATNPGTYPIASNNFGSGAGGYNFTTPVLFTGDSNDNNVTATEFADFMTGAGGNDIFDGGLGNDSLWGDDGNDSLWGGGGSDTISGGNGNDTLIGGLGTNALSGGDGVDVFVFSSGTTAGGGDIITSYSIADDVINLDKAGFAAFTTGAGLLASSFYAYSSTASITVLESTLTGPSIMAIYDGAATKLYYDSNGSTVGGNNLFATVDVNLGVSGNSELFLF